MGEEMSPLISKFGRLPDIYLPEQVLRLRCNLTEQVSPVNLVEPSYRRSLSLLGAFYLFDREHLFSATHRRPWCPRGASQGLPLDCATMPQDASLEAGGHEGSFTRHRRVLGHPGAMHTSRCLRLPCT